MSLDNSNSENENLFIFKMESNDKIEIEVKDDLNDDNVIFTAYGYFRGGGVQNAAMEYNDVLFTVDELKYDVYYVWSVNEDNPEIDNEPIFGLQIFQDNKVIEDMRGINCALLSTHFL